MARKKPKQHATKRRRYHTHAKTVYVSPWYFDWLKGFSTRVETKINQKNWEIWEKWPRVTYNITRFTSLSSYPIITGANEKEKKTKQKQTAAVQSLFKKDVTVCFVPVCSTRKISTETYVLTIVKRCYITLFTS